MSGKFPASWNIVINDDIKMDFSHLAKIGTSRRKVFSEKDDRLIAHLVSTKICQNWYEVSQYLPGKTPRQCRDRWINYICPTNSFEPWTPEEDMLLIDKINEFGTRWTLIAQHIPGRSDNCIKNRWYAVLRSQCTKSQGTYRLKADIRPTLAQNQENCVANTEQTCIKSGSILTHTSAINDSHDVLVADFDVADIEIEHPWTDAEVFHQPDNDFWNHTNMFGHVIPLDNQLVRDEYNLLDIIHS